MMDPKFMRAMALYGALGFELAATIVVCLYLGYFFDQKFSSSPWLLILGLFFGLAVGGMRMMQTITKLSKDTDSE